MSRKNCSTIFRLLAFVPLCLGPEAGQVQAFEFSCPVRDADHPLGIYLGPSRLTSSYYNARNKPVLVANVAADPAWQALTLSKVLQGQGSCWDLFVSDTFHAPSRDHPRLIVGSDKDQDTHGTCGDILPSFLASLTKLMRESERQLGHHAQIGYIVVPSNLRDFFPIINEVMHVVYKFPRSSFRLDECDIFDLAIGAQYGYDLVDITDEWGAGGMDEGLKGPVIPPFAEDDYMLFINVEDDFLEMGYRCLHIGCYAPLTRRVTPNHGLRLYAGLTSTVDREATWAFLPPMSFEFSETVGFIAETISEFIAENPYVAGQGVIRAVVLIGGGSSILLDATTHALPHALPEADPSIFLTFRDPAFVPSLGAARMIRNIQMQERKNSETTYCGIVNSI